jgi:hypothetical protein
MTALGQTGKCQLRLGDGGCSYCRHFLPLCINIRWHEWLCSRCIGKQRIEPFALPFWRTTVRTETGTAALSVRKLIGENVNPVNFWRFGKEVACLGFFLQSRRNLAI